MGQCQSGAKTSRPTAFFRTVRWLGAPGMSPQALRFTLHDGSAGYEVSTRRVPLALLRGFTKEVDVFLHGGPEGLDTAALEVSLADDALAIETAPILHAALMHDLQLMAMTPILSGMTPQRRAVVLRWQRQARRTRLFRIEITAPCLDRPLVIDADSGFCADDPEAWVNVERYVRGQLEELGGHAVVNAHLRLFDGRSLTVATDKAQLASEPRNRLYKTALLRIRASYNIRTGQYRDAELIEFVEHDRRLDARELDELTRRGVRAWHGLPPLGAWLDVQRGAAG